MLLLPTQQTAKQLEALRTFLEHGRLEMWELCDCGGQTRHNNGGNYHEEIELRADGGQWFAKFGSTSDYDDAEWESIEFSNLLDLIQQKAAAGYGFRGPR